VVIAECRRKRKKERERKAECPPFGNLKRQLLVSANDRGVVAECVNESKVIGSLELFVAAFVRREEEEERTLPLPHTTLRAPCFVS
jgi:hypothetical protein